MPTNSDLQTMMREIRLQRIKDRALGQVTEETVQASQDLKATPSQIAEIAGGKPVSPRTKILTEMGSVTKAESTTAPGYNAEQPLAGPEVAPGSGRTPANDIRQKKATFMQDVWKSNDHKTDKIEASLWEITRKFNPYWRAGEEGLKTLSKIGTLGYDFMTRFGLPVIQGANVGTTEFLANTDKQGFRAIFDEDDKSVAEKIKALNGWSDERSLASIAKERAAKLWSGELKLDARANAEILFGLATNDWLHKQVIMGTGLASGNAGQGAYVSNPATAWAQFMSPAGIWTRLQQAKRMRNAEIGRADPEERITWGDLTDEAAYWLLDPVGLAMMEPKIVTAIPAGIWKFGNLVTKHRLGAATTRFVTQPLSTFTYRMGQMGMVRALEPFEVFGEASPVTNMILDHGLQLETAMVKHGKVMNSWIKKQMDSPGVITAREVKRSMRTSRFRDMAELGQQGGYSKPWGNGAEQARYVVQGKARFVIDPTRKALSSSGNSALRPVTVPVETGTGTMGMRTFLVPAGTETKMAGELAAIMRREPGLERSMRLRLARGDDVSDINAWVAALAKKNKWTPPNVNKAWGGIRKDGLLNGRRVTRRTQTVYDHGPSRPMSEIDVHVERGGDVSQRMAAVFSGRLPHTALTDDELALLRPLRDHFVENLIRPAAKLQTRIWEKDAETGKPVAKLKRIFNMARFDDPDNWAVFENIRPLLWDPNPKHVPVDVSRLVSPKHIADVWFPVATDVSKASLLGQPLDHFDLYAQMEAMTYMIERKRNMEPMFKAMTDKKFLRSLDPMRRDYLKEWVGRQAGTWEDKGITRLDNMIGSVINETRAFEGKIPIAGRMRRQLEEFNLFRKKTFRFHGGEQLPSGSPSMELAGKIQSWILRGILGGDARSAFQNPFLLTNVVARHKPSGLLRGLTREFDPAFATARAEANLLGSWQGLMTDQNYRSLLAHGEHAMDMTNPYIGAWDRTVFALFDRTEMLPKSVQFNISYENRINELLATGSSELGGAKTIPEFLAGASVAMKQDAMSAAYAEAMFVTHMYGGLNRAPMMFNPILRTFGTLMSFTPKQTGFLVRTAKKNSTGLVRYFAMSSLIVDRFNRELGFDANAYVGLGFKPMTRTFGGIPMVETPIGRLFDSFYGATVNLGQPNGDPRLGQQFMSDFSKQMGFIVGGMGPGTAVMGRAAQRTIAMAKQVSTDQKTDTAGARVSSMRDDQAITEWLFGPDREGSEVRHAIRKITTSEKQFDFALRTRVDHLAGVIYNEKSTEEDVTNAWRSIWAKPYNVGSKTLIANQAETPVLEALEERIMGRLETEHERMNTDKFERKVLDMDSMVREMYFNDIQNVRKIQMPEKVK